MGCGALAQVLAVAPEKLVDVLEFRQQFSNVHGEIVGQAQTHAACLDAGSGFGRHPPKCPLHVNGIVGVGWLRIQLVVVGDVHAAGTATTQAHSRRELCF